MLLASYKTIHYMYCYRMFGYVIYNNMTYISPYMQNPTYYDNLLYY